MERRKQSWEGPSLNTLLMFVRLEKDTKHISFTRFHLPVSICPGSGMQHKEREGPLWRHQETKQHRSHSGVLLVETSCFILVRKSLELKETLRSKSA